MSWLEDLHSDVRPLVTATPKPQWLEPMAATLTKDRFDDEDWMFERKLDGFRYLAFVSGGEARLVTRNRIRHRHEHVEEALLSQPPDDFIVDGEMVPFGRAAAADTSVIRGYHVFDVLWLDGYDLTQLPLTTRKALLSAAFDLAPPLAKVDELEMSGTDAYALAVAEGWEGIIAKRRASVYEHRRSKQWLKMKCDASQELVVGGFTTAGGSGVGLKSLLVGYYDGDDLVFAGRISAGGSPKTAAELRARLDPLRQDATPFTSGVGLPRKEAHWVRPDVVVQATFMEWTSNNKLRHPRLSGIRDDKLARDVVRES